jgi:hypothetical protein
MREKTKRLFLAVLLKKAFSEKAGGRFKEHALQ